MKLRLSFDETLVPLLESTSLSELQASILKAEGVVKANQAGSGLLEAAKWWARAQESSVKPKLKELLEALETHDAGLGALCFVGSLNQHVRADFYYQLSAWLVEEWPESAAAWYHHSKVLQSQHLTAEAEKALLQSFSIFESEDAAVELIELYATTKGWSEIKKFEQKWKGKFKDSVAFLQVLGRAYKMQGLYSKSLACYQEAMDINSDSIAVLWDLFQVLYLMGASDEGRRVFEKITLRTEEHLMAKILTLVSKREVENIWRIFIQLDERQVDRQTLLFLTNEILRLSVEDKLPELLKSVKATIFSLQLFSKESLYWLRRVGGVKKLVREFHCVCEIKAHGEYEDGVDHYLRVLRVLAVDESRARTYLYEFLATCEPEGDRVIKTCEPQHSFWSKSLNYPGVSDYLAERIIFS